MVSVFGFGHPKSHFFAPKITENGRFRVQKNGTSDARIFHFVVHAEDRDIELNNYKTTPGKIPTYSCHNVSVTNVQQTTTAQYHSYLRVSCAGRTKCNSVK